MGENGNTSEITENYEEIFREQGSKPSVALYRHRIPVNTVGNHSKSAQDVIANVSKQIKAINNADCLKSSRKAINLNKYKKSTFLPVNMLRKDEDPPPQKQKFDTQLFTDTQLINVVQDAEEQYAHGIVTQDFEQTFCEDEEEEIEDIPTENKTRIQEHFPILDISLKEDKNKIDSPNIGAMAFQHTEGQKFKFKETIASETDIELFSQDIEDYTNINNKDDVQAPSSPVISIKTNKSKHNLLPKVTDRQNDFDTQHVSLKTEERQINIDLNEDTEITPSPIINIKTKPSKHNAENTALTVNLDTFEKFEEIAQPIIVTVSDSTIAKQMIDSQIIDKELFIDNYSESYLLNYGKVSPIIDLNDAVLVVDKETILKNVEEQNVDRKTDKGDKSVFKDEILFSSDEESDSINKSYQDLPFTCALETSFYNQSKDLNTTMYVGFQMANNRSIKINTDSFMKAQSVLDCVEKELTNEGSLSNLVEAIDRNLTKEKRLVEDDGSMEVDNENDNMAADSENDNEYAHLDFIELAVKDKAVDVLKELNSQNDVLKNTDEVDNCKTDKDHFVGFKTASNKTIELSEKALARSKKVFQDINLSKDFNLNTEIFEELERVEESYKEDDLDDEVLQEFQEDIAYEEFEENNKKIEQSEKMIEFVGFKTASNKNIQISDAALARTKNIFQDLDIDANIDSNTEDNANKIYYTEIDFDKPTEKTKTPEIRFRTASNKNITISDKAKENTKHMFQDIIEIDKGRELSENDVHKLAQPSTSKAFIGFKTASNKNINLSKEALSKTKHLFQDIDNDVFLKPAQSNNKNENSFTGFRTASNKKVCTSKEALAKSKRIFEGIDIDTSNGDKDIAEMVEFQQVLEEKDTNTHFKDKKIAPEDKEPPFYGFEQNDNNVTLFEEAIAMSQKIFEKIEKDIKEDVNKPFKGFQTASFKPVSISAEAMAKSNKFFEGFNVPSEKDFENEACNDTQNIMNIKDKCNEHKTLAFEGFKTASNRKVEISETALAKSRKLFFDIDAEINTKMDTDVKEASFKGFQTASNKPLQVSADALTKSRKIFSDIDKDIDTKMDTDVKEASFKGFQTASKKPVQISEEALAKSRKIFSDIAKDIDTKMDAGTKDASFKGFQTASKKPVQISEEALAKSRKIFSDIDKDIDTKMNTDVKEASFKGFQTASNKPVQVSADALAKSRKIFNDIDNNIDTEIDTGVKNTEFKGFQTASKKPVKISEEALAKSKKILEGIDNSDADLSKGTTSFKGFKTAGEKEVNISEEALAKTRKTFEGIDNSNTNVSKSKFTCFQTASKKTVQISEDALAESRKIFQDIEKDCNKQEYTKTKENQGSIFKTANRNEVKISEDALLKSKKLLSETKLDYKTQDKLDDIDSQLLSDFEVTLYTEDFTKEPLTPKTSKRSGSPILSCPKAKRRKTFQTPYSQKALKPKETTFIPPITAKSDQIVNFKPYYKVKKIFTLKNLEKLEKESRNETFIDPYIKEFDYKNLLDFKFSGKRNELSDKSTNLDDIKRLFLDTVNKKLVPEGWIENHTKQILWKLLSYEIKFPKTMSYTCTVQTTIDQLKYRYDKELYNTQRPALRKILEKDDTSMRTLVLCVVAIYCEDNSTSHPELLLTDGWYNIRTIIDKMLATLVHKNKIVVGTKLVTHGAELVGSEQAVSPWEDTSSIRLKITGNSTRRAKWNARLGYHSNGAMLTQLSNISPDGGKVAKLRVYVTRVYPMLFVEKFEDGSTVTRSERLENIHQMKYETERQELLEKLYEEAEKEVYEQDSQDSDSSQSGSKRKCLDGGSQVAKILKRSKDLGEFTSNITPSQREMITKHALEKREKLLQAIQDRVQIKMSKVGLSARNVVPLLKIRVAGIEERNCDLIVTKAMISIWKPNEAVTEIIKEGSWIEVMNVVPTALRYSEIQISAGRQSIFSQSKYKETEKVKLYKETLKRTCYSIKDLVKNPSMSTEYNEIDTVGIIIQIDPPYKEFEPSKNQFQNIYLADADKNIISINFWGGIKKFGFEKVLDTGQVVAGTNLQKRAGNTRKNVPQYRGTEFSVFTKTPKNESARKMVEDLSKIMSGLDAERFIKDCVNLRNHYHLKLQAKEDISPYRVTNVDINSSKNKNFIESPLAHKNLKDDLNLTGLDFESTFKQDTQEISPKTLLRKKQIQEKITKLRRYGEPPPLSPIQIINKSKNAGNAFKSPLLSKSDVSANSVASEKKNLPIEKENLNEQFQSSPVFSLNKTYVKKSNVNPVKLNFSNVAINESSISDVADDFAEEFDGSPPLSLD